jgi:acyl-CoA synthetase (AMP-forming)/AMP-acid ligase II
MASWNIADLWDTIAAVQPEAPAVVHGQRRRTWAQLERNAAGLEATLLAAGLRRQDTVAQHLYNGIEYVEALFGSFKASLVPVNTNHRYLEDELIHLWRDAGVAAVVFDAAFTAR